jgi:chemotaxis protein methyltransferase CheR
MTNPFPTALLLPLSELIAQHLGLHFPADRAADLQRGIAAAARDLGFADSEACAQSLLARPLTPAQRDVLARHLTVGETYFFRDKLAFNAVEQHVLPELIRARRGRDPYLRIWSAACCTGEEAYSLAICVRRALPDIASWRVTILGTDLNPQFLEKATRGVFSDWSFRDTPPAFRENYFTRTADGHWEILPQLRGMVTFNLLNLVADTYPSLEQNTQAMDLIFCRNALIYFDSERAVRVIHDLAHCLTDSGWLVLGPNELSQAKSAALAPVTFPGAILHRKSSAVKGARPAPFVWEAPESAITFTPPAPAPVSFAPAPPLTDHLPEPTPAPPLEAAAATEGAAPHNPIALARALANNGDLAAALAACDRVLAGDKMNHAGHYLRAGILQELGHLPEAGLALKRALYLEPDFVLAHFTLGNLARRLGKFAEADRYLENALALARAQSPEEILPEAEGLTAGRLAEMITALRAAKAVA